MTEKINNNMLRSELERIKLRKDRLEFINMIKRLDKKWTTIWLGTIFIYTALGTVFAFTGFNSASFGMLVANYKNV